MLTRPVARIALIVLLSVSCVSPPIMYQDGLAATTPQPGHFAARIGYNQSHWWHGDISVDLGPYLGGGVRTGQDWGRFCFEEGLTLLYPDALLPCLQCGVGLRSPAIMIRALWTPLSVSRRVRFAPLLWWQGSALVGTPRRQRGFGASCGIRTSPTGIGPVTALDYAAAGGSARLEGSMAFRPPWAKDENIQGRVLMLGLTMEPTIR
jgi:hypothetical protein